MGVVDDFFDAHDARLGIGVQQDFSELEGPRTHGDIFLVKRSGLDDKSVASELERCGFGVRGSDLYREFLNAASYRALDCDGLVEFATTTSIESWSDDVRRFRGTLDPTQFFAFGFDPATSAVFCLHRVEPDSEPVISIVDQGQVIPRIFSSFSALLEVVTRVLRSDVVLFVERKTSPTAEQRTFVESLRAIDPAGFGRFGWPAWYRRAVGGDDWDDNGGRVYKF